MWLNWHLPGKFLSGQNEGDKGVNVRAFCEHCELYLFRGMKGVKSNLSLQVDFSIMQNCVAKQEIQTTN